MTDEEEQEMKEATCELRKTLDNWKPTKKDAHAHGMTQHQFIGKLEEICQKFETGFGLGRFVELDENGLPTYERKKED